jgi:hypothetical protein
MVWEGINQMILVVIKSKLEKASRFRFWELEVTDVVEVGGRGPCDSDSTGRVDIRELAVPNISDHCLPSVVSWSFRSFAAFGYIQATSWCPQFPHVGCISSHWAEACPCRM